MLAKKSLKLLRQRLRNFRRNKCGLDLSRLDLRCGLVEIFIVFGTIMDLIIGIGIFLEHNYKLYSGGRERSLASVSENPAPTAE